MRKPEILRNKDDFSALYKKGQSIGSKYVVLFFKKNGLPYNRRAFLASKKVGNSVKRNRARRLMKESFRTIEQSLSPGYDILFIARNTITSDDAKCKMVKNSMVNVLKRAKLI